MNEELEQLRNMLAIYKANRDQFDVAKHKAVLMEVETAIQLMDERDKAFEDLRRLHEITEELRNRTISTARARNINIERDQIFALYAGRF